jgi:DNA-binding transcriptional regulator GbsR (MarR family)
MPVRAARGASARVCLSLALLYEAGPPSKISVEIVTPVQAEHTVNLTPAAQKFVLHWGEMGQAWGINRTMAQVHALLFVSPSPLDAEEISRLLDVSRSNVSTSLRELITWGVVRRVHIIGDRRDRFEALKDVMETFRVIMAERKRREMDPTIALLENCVREAKAGDDSEQYTREQLDKMLEFTRMVTTWYGHIDNLSTPALLRLFRGGAMLAKLFTRGKSRTPVAESETAEAGVVTS